MLYDSALKPKLIYVFRINDAVHSGCMKIGEATLPDGSDVFNLATNSHILIKAAKNRIDQYTKTAGIEYELLYTEVTLYISGGTVKSFNDKEVHEVLLRSGIKRREGANLGSEWFETDLPTIINAIKAVKEGRKSLLATEITEGQNPIIFRPEQREAIEKTKERFKKGNQMLWNAKMRFGKTLSALQVIKDLNFRRTLILTHRPVVDDGWYEDFKKIFYDREDFRYGSKLRGEKFPILEAGAQEEKLRYIYFASMQDLRGSETVGGKFDKNNEIFSTSWNFIIIDEAHEGTQTELGQNVIRELTKPTTKVLSLSGTPFNLFDGYTEDETYTWDYVMEQKAKAQWDLEHFGDPNPYAGLPKMNIFTYDLGKLLTDYIDEDVAFNFREFFRVNDSGEFVHSKDVAAFLDLLCKKDIESAYPFSNEVYRNIFRHTLWMVPGVKSALALQRMLETHPVFQHFTIVNVAGEGDPTEQENAEALALLRSKIGNDPDQSLTITLSCGRLTTGVSVKEWTAVFMLSGSFNTAAAGYMQTIFRVQTPATINGRVKEQCYVFDFAPDRTLKVLAETAKISTKAGKTSGDDRQAMGEFLNFCPVIGMDGSKMRNYDVDTMLQQLKKVYIESVVNNGFEDGYLYNDELMKLDPLAIEQFEDLKNTIGTTKAMPKTDSIDINTQGLTGDKANPDDSETGNGDSGTKPGNKGLTDEDKIRQEELKQKRKLRETAISILRGISIRMPLMIYGADIDDETQEITIDNFTSLIDHLSWEEFMPRGVTKQKFNAFRKYYDRDIFAAAAKRIRSMVRSADRLSIEQRIERITQIFATFRNPDKETVLTPWRVVNMHISDTIGGYTFFDSDFDEKKTLADPRFVERGKVTAEVFNPDTRILEINSKTGLYPLYMAYSTYRARVASLIISPESVEDEWKVWSQVVAENIFVICKTPMAKSITKRTLVGFRPLKVNTRYFEDLINQIKNKPNNFIEKVAKGKSFWKAINNDNMKFNAIVGNPPYQIMDGGTDRGAIPVYQHFFSISIKLRPLYCSMIMPSRWYAGGRGLDTFREKMMNDKHLRVLLDYELSKDLFKTVDIAGGLCVILWDKNYCGMCKIINNRALNFETAYRYLNDYPVIIRSNAAIPILKKVSSRTVSYLNEKVLSINPFGFRTFFRGSEKGDIRILTSKGWSYVNYTEITKGEQYIDQYKIIVGRFVPSNGEMSVKPGEGYRVLTEPKILKPKEINTETYIDTAVFNSEIEAESYSKYLHTKFARYLLRQGVTSVNITKECFAFVPLQDFTEESDIDWSKSVKEIDAQLYKKYNLSDDEIAFIESMIKPM